MASGFRRLDGPDWMSENPQTCYGKIGEGGQEAASWLFWPAGSLGVDVMTIFGVQVP